MPSKNKTTRKDQILRSLARLLETSPGTRITTASLASHVGVSEAALYRHFPSKRSIYAELFSFCDNTIFSKCNELKKQKISSKDKVKNAFIFFILFVEKNKGFARLLSREALTSDEKNVSDNVNQFYERFELIMFDLLNFFNFIFHIILIYKLNYFFPIKYL